MENFSPGDLLNEAASQMGETFKSEVSACLQQDAWAFFMEGVCRFFFCESFYFEGSN